MHIKHQCYAITHLKEVSFMEVHIFYHPQALLHPPLTTPRDFVGQACVYEPKLKQKVLPLTKQDSIQIIFICLLCLYQKKPLSAEKPYSCSSFQLFFRTNVTRNNGIKTFVINNIVYQKVKDSLLYVLRCHKCDHKGLTFICLFSCNQKYLT